jgi:hypothetical protein
VLRASRTELIEAVIALRIGPIVWSYAACNPAPIPDHAALIAFEIGPTTCLNSHVYAFAIPWIAGLITLFQANPSAMPVARNRAAVASKIQLDGEQLLRRRPPGHVLAGALRRVRDPLDPLVGAVHRLAGQLQRRVQPFAPPVIFLIASE